MTSVRVARLLAVLFFFGLGFPAETFAQDPGLADMNRRLIRKFHGTGTKRKAPPSWAQDGFHELSRRGIPLFVKNLDLAQARQVKHVILQEYLRRQQDWGMPWLPMSWRDHAGRPNYALFGWQAARTALENTLNRVGTKRDDSLLVAYLLNAVVYHSNHGNLVNQFRQAAIDAYRYDSRFKDLRHEVHDAPSWATIERLERYIKRASNSNAIHYAKLTIKYLKAALGHANVDQFLSLYTLNNDASNVLRSYQGIANSLKRGRKLTQAIDLLRQLGQVAQKYGARLRRHSNRCQPDPKIDCKYEYLDLLKQFQLVVFSIGSSINELTRTKTVDLSTRDCAVIIDAYASTIHSIGLMSDSTVQSIRRETNKFSQGQIKVAEFSRRMTAVEQTLGRTTQRLKGIFSGTLKMYRDFVPGVDRFVDDTLRMNSLLPFSNFLAKVHQKVQHISGQTIAIEGKNLLGSFRILNPGISKGKLVVPSNAELGDENYMWDPNAIYLFRKTPSFLQKVAGVLSAGSGSMISHVQLLASNHGIPNVHIGQSILRELAKLEGREVLLVSLPNGEAIVKQFNDATREELEVYRKYNRVRQKVKVQLRRPARLDINYPLKIEQLRIEDSGVVAGGKAAGQGELAQVFPDRVPKGVVLPFGVYDEHLRESGVYEKVRAILADRSLRGSDPDTVTRRRRALQDIRQKIQAIELKPEVVRFMVRILLNGFYRRRGVFVRSDTNAEDLPGFVGAGLNKTVPNVIGVSRILASVKAVWASPFTEKAFTWREDLIDNPWDIYPSVLVQLAAPSELAGVMIVGSPNTDDKTDMIYLAANEGIGITTVAGEYAAEEVQYMRKDKRIVRLRSAYANKKKVLGSKGGIEEVTITPGNRVMSDQIVRELAAIGDKIQRHLAKKDGKVRKWDLEWGVLNGKVVLFQIRPFIGNKVLKNVAELKRLESGQASNDYTVDVSDKFLKLGK